MNQLKLFSIVLLFFYFHPLYASLSKDLSRQVESKYGPSAVSELSVFLSDAHKDKLPVKFLELRIKEAIAKRVPYSELKKMLGSKITVLKKARSFADQCKERKFEIKHYDDFVIRISEFMEVGVPEQMFGEIAKIAYKKNTDEMLIAALDLQMTANRILKDEKLTFELIANLKHLRPRDIQKINRVLSEIPPDRFGKIKIAVTKFINTKNINDFYKELKSMQPSDWKTEAASEIAEEKKRK